MIRLFGNQIKWAVCVTKRACLSKSWHVALMSIGGEGNEGKAWVEGKRLTHEANMKQGWPALLVFAVSVWRQLQLWIRTCIAIASCIADALHEAEFGTQHVG